MSIAQSSVKGFAHINNKQTDNRTSELEGTEACCSDSIQTAALIRHSLKGIFHPKLHFTLSRITMETQHFVLS